MQSVAVPSTGKKGNLMAAAFQHQQHEIERMNAAFDAQLTSLRQTYSTRIAELEEREARYRQRMTALRAMQGKSARKSEEDEDPHTAPNPPLSALRRKETAKEEEEDAERNDILQWTLLKAHNNENHMKKEEDGSGPHGSTSAPPKPPRHPSLSTTNVKESPRNESSLKSPLSRSRKPKHPSVKRSSTTSQPAALKFEKNTNEIAKEEPKGRRSNAIRTRNEISNSDEALVEQSRLHDTAATSSFSRGENNEKNHQRPPPRASYRSPGRLEEAGEGGQDAAQEPQRTRGRGDEEEASRLLLRHSENANPNDARVRHRRNDSTSPRAVKERSAASEKSAVEGTLSDSVLSLWAKNVLKEEVEEGSKTLEPRKEVTNSLRQLSLARFTPTAKTKV